MDWQIISRIADFCGIISLIPILLSFIYILRSDVLHHRRYLKKIRDKKADDDDAILIVDIGESAIRPSVEKWVYKQEKFRNLPKENIYSVICKKKRIEELDLDSFLKAFRKERNEIYSKGLSTIHLFYRGPVIIATIIGAELSNGRPVIFYQNDTRNPEGYVNWGAIER